MTRTDWKNSPMAYWGYQLFVRGGVALAARHRQTPVYPCMNLLDSFLRTSLKIALVWVSLTNEDI
jgi:hypothetical protein